MDGIEVVKLIDDLWNDIVLTDIKSLMAFLCVSLGMRLPAGHAASQPSACVVEEEWVLWRIGGKCLGVTQEAPMQILCAKDVC